MHKWETLFLLMTFSSWLISDMHVGLFLGEDVYWLVGFLHLGEEEFESHLASGRLKGFTSALGPARPGSLRSPPRFCSNPG